VSRPLYETSEDLGRERDVVANIEKRWSCQAQKLPMRYKLDYALMRNGKVSAWAEIKCRGQRYATYLISLDKVSAGLRLSEISSLPFLIVVRYDDGTYYCTVTKDLVYDIEWGGRKDRNDPEDQEPVLMIPMKFFLPL